MLRQAKELLDPPMVGALMDITLHAKKFRLPWSLSEGKSSSSHALDIRLKLFRVISYIRSFTKKIVTS